MKQFFVFLFSVLFIHALYCQEHTRPYLQPFKVAMIQSVPVWGDVEKNLVNCADHIKNCEQCDLIVLPELFTTGILMKKKDPAASVSQKKQVAVYYPKIVETMKQWALQSQAVVMGSTVYMEDEKFFNRLIAAFPDGSIQFYNKHNCFKKGGYTPGEEQLILEYKGHKIATYICYDLRFPEWSRNNNRYDVAVYVANWPLSRHDDWERLLRERAVENKATIIGVNCTGEDIHGLKYAGESMAINPQGEIINKGDKFAEQVIYAELD